MAHPDDLLAVARPALVDRGARRGGRRGVLVGVAVVPVWTEIAIAAQVPGAAAAGPAVATTAAVARVDATAARVSRERMRGIVGLPRCLSLVPGTTRAGGDRLRDGDGLRARVVVGRVCPGRGPGSDVPDEAPGWCPRGRSAP